ncbi:hypothetical protein C8J33_11945 [Rhizobium sp. PP-CC-3G-465]|nr:hypothetical protein C8J33_11945 [Rhizobium sp. PP-CC-3G-465]
MHTTRTLAIRLVSLAVIMAIYGRKQPAYVAFGETSESLKL